MELALQNIDIEELCIFHHLACRVVARCVRVPKATRGPPSPRLRRDSLRSPLPLRAKTGGKGIRTPHFQLAKLALYQLSYAPEKSKIENGRWKMRDCNGGSAGCQPAGFGSLPKQSSLSQTRLCERIAGRLPPNCRPAACAPQSRDRKGNAGSRFTRDPAFVDVQQQRLNCALPSFSLSSGFFRFQSLYGMPSYFQYCRSPGKSETNCVLQIS